MPEEKRNPLMCYFTKPFRMYFSNFEQGNEIAPFLCVVTTTVGSVCTGTRQILWLFPLFPAHTPPLTRKFFFQTETVQQNVYLDKKKHIYWFNGIIAAFALGIIWSKWYLRDSCVTPIFLNISSQISKDRITEAMTKSSLPKGFHKKRRFAIEDSLRI